MMTKPRFIRIFAVFAAGYLPFALLWRSTGAVQAFLIGAAAAVAVALIIRWRDLKAREPR